MNIHMKEKKETMEIYYGKKFEDYDLRDKNLRILGYSSYKEYLDSELWKSIKKFLLKNKTKCAICPYKARVLHHKSYGINVLSGWDINELIPLCNHHHDKIEFTYFAKNAKTKNDLVETNIKLENILINGEEKKILPKTKDELKYGPLSWRESCYKCSEQRICSEYSYQEYNARICAECKKDIDLQLAKFKDKKYKLLTIKNWMST